MKRILPITILLALFFSCGNGKKLFPRKYLGNYSGVQSAYTIKMNKKSIDIPSSKYSLVLSYGKLWLTTTQQKLAATYQLKANTEKYYSLRVKMENGVVEEWRLWKKDRKLVRESTSPQPAIIFYQE